MPSYYRNLALVDAELAICQSFDLECLRLFFAADSG